MASGLNAAETLPAPLPSAGILERLPYTQCGYGAGDTKMGQMWSA